MSVTKRKTKDMKKSELENENKELKNTIEFLTRLIESQKQEIDNLKFNLNLTEETLKDYRKIANKFVTH